MEKNYWFGDIREKFSDLSQNQTLIFRWLVGNAVFSEMALKIFLIFCIKLGDCKGRKVTEPDFWKKFLIWRYSWKCIQISPKSGTFIFFSKMTLMTFLVFGLKLVLHMTFNLNETHFSEKLAIWRYLTMKSSNLGFLHPNYLTQNAWSIFFWFSSLKLVFNYHFHMNVTCFTKKLLFPRFLTLKMLPKSFQNYPKIEVFGQFFKNKCKGFPDFTHNFQKLLKLRFLAILSTLHY